MAVGVGNKASVSNYLLNLSSTFCKFIAKTDHTFVLILLL